MDIYRDDNVTVNYEAMPSGELRYRLIGSPGGSYIRTIATSSAWENSHFHKLLMEMYIVQQGWVIFAQYVSDTEITLTKYSAGEHFAATPLLPHNIYMSEGAITHTVKYGEADNSDWNEFKRLDELLAEIDPEKYLSEDFHGTLSFRNNSI